MSMLLRASVSCFSGDVLNSLRKFSKAAVTFSVLFLAITRGLRETYSAGPCSQPAPYSVRAPC